MGAEQIGGMIGWALLVSEVCRHLFYVGGTLALIAVIAWVLYGDNQMWTLSDAFRVVFIAALLLGVVGFFIALLATAK